MAITQAELDNRFDLHPATPVTGPVMDALRATLKETAHQVIARTPSSREQSLAITALEEALFWANASVARHGNDAAPVTQTLSEFEETDAQLRQTNG